MRRQTGGPRGTWLQARSPAALLQIWASSGQRSSRHPHPTPGRGGRPGSRPVNHGGIRSCALPAPAHCSSEGDKHREIQSSAASGINRCAGLHRSGDNAPAPPYAPALALHLPGATGTRLLGGRLRPPSLQKWLEKAGVELEKKEARLLTNTEQNLGFGTNRQGSDGDPGSVAK